MRPSASNGQKVIARGERAERLLGNSDFQSFHKESVERALQDIEFTDIDGSPEASNRVVEAARRYQMLLQMEKDLKNAVASASNMTKVRAKSGA